MRFLAEEGDRVAFHALGSQHDAERQLHAFQHRPLLDVQLQVSGRVLLLARRIGKTIDGEAAACDSVFQADAVFVGAAAVGFDGGGAGECRRAQQAAAKARAFFVRPIHHAHGDRRPSRKLFRKTAQHFETGRNAQAAIQPSAVRHGIQMAAEDQRLLRRTRQRGPAIAGGIVMMLHGQSLDLGLKPFARLEPGIRPRDALRAVVVGGQCAQFL